MNEAYFAANTRNLKKLSITNGLGRGNNEIPVFTRMTIICC